VLTQSAPEQSASLLQLLRMHLPDPSSVLQKQTPPQSSSELHPWRQVHRPLARFWHGT
jgi:hypothetical protein